MAETLKTGTVLSWFTRLIEYQKQIVLLLADLKKRVEQLEQQKGARR